MKMIICSGVMRSASTWAYNFLRVVISLRAEQDGQPFECAYSDDLDELLTGPYIEQPGFAVIKTHNLGREHYARRVIDQGGLQNVCTVRDPRDCVASRQEFKKESLETSLAMVKASFDGLQFMGNRTLWVDYVSIKRDPKSVGLAILKYLQYKTPDDEAFVEGIVSEMTPEKMAERSAAVTAPQADDVTQLHRNHIHGGEIGRWAKDFNGHDRAKVHRALEDQLRWYHYLFPNRGAKRDERRSNDQSADKAGGVAQSVGL